MTLFHYFCNTSFNAAQKLLKRVQKCPDSEDEIKHKLCINPVSIAHFMSRSIDQHSATENSEHFANLNPINQSNKLQIEWNQSQTIPNSNRNKYIKIFDHNFLFPIGF